VFLEFCERALAEPDETFVFVIDEINRGNLSKILGELMVLIEPDKRAPEWGVKLAYALSAEERFYVPANLYLLGMMNTADRSLSLVDYALRRRFSFASLQPQFQSAGFRQLLNERGAPSEIVDQIVTRFDALNTEIAEDKIRLGPGFKIGHSYFVPREKSGPLDAAWYRAVIECEIAPLLREYWFDDQKTADGWTEALLEGVE
jgi:hypothetical protein